MLLSVCWLSDTSTVAGSTENVLCCRANIVGCIICPNASVAAGSELRDCLIGSGQTVSGVECAVLIQFTVKLAVFMWCLFLQG